MIILSYFTWPGRDGTFYRRYVQVSVEWLISVECRMCRWKNAHVSIFNGDMDKRLRLTFLGPPCMCIVANLLGTNPNPYELTCRNATLRVAFAVVHQWRRASYVSNSTVKQECSLYSSSLAEAAATLQSEMRNRLDDGSTWCSLFTLS